MNPLEIVLRNYPHTTILKNGTVPIESIDCQFPDCSPTNPIFMHAVHHLSYDVSETAIVTFLQAREAGYPISLLPVILLGGFHHRSMKRLKGNNPLTPREFKGNKVGIGSYVQPGGLWVRGLLKEEYEIEPSDVTWVTTRGPFVNGYVEPPFVERTATPLTTLLRNGEIVALITTGTTLLTSASHVNIEGSELTQVIPDTSDADDAWIARHHTIPVNHMLTVQTQILDSRPAAVRSIYRGFARAIEETHSDRGVSDSDRVISAGLNDQLMTAVDLAIRYGLEQELIHEEISAEQLFSRSSIYLD